MRFGKNISALASEFYDSLNASKINMYLFKFLIRILCEPIFLVCILIIDSHESVFI